MTSDLPHPTEAFVWTWLAGATAPVVAGRLIARDDMVRFAYGRSYLARADAQPLYEPELPLRSGLLPLPAGMTIPSAIRDAAPDAWGRRVILNRAFGVKGDALNDVRLDELVFLLESGSDRIGAIDFQRSAEIYAPRATTATLDQLMASAARVEQNLPLSAELDQALHHGSSIGGARPKALVTAGQRKFVAKFSSTGDVYSVVRAEYVAMRLAALAGLNVAGVTLEHVSGRDVLLIDRFDRIAAGDDQWTRRAMVSALTMLGLDEMMARYASYEDLAEIVRHRFADPGKTLRELFGRITFNILAGNTDDHARNHAAFWDGAALTLTPAYDICPQGRAGQEATQAMLIVGDDRSSRIETALAAAPHFHLDEAAATALIAAQVRVIGDKWHAVCDEAGMGAVDRAFLWGRQFLNPYTTIGLRSAAASLDVLVAGVREGRDGDATGV
ncbi:type II toxin-antitoxin system HipA family toxin [Sphingomonas sp. So64.6b]|nr:type II toxin-antitoxin system HipA family toxin [Sphingomonas sp. So64.6b]